MVNKLHSGRPRNSLEVNVEGLRDYSPPPLTYKKYQRLSDGSEVFVGEFNAPDVRLQFNQRRGK